MKLAEFARALLPKLEKRDLLEDLRLSSEEMDKGYAVCYQQAGEFFRTSKLNSDANKNLSDVFYRNFDLQGAGKAPNFIMEISRRLGPLKENIEYVRDLVSREMETIVVTDALTAKKALIVRAAESVSFISRFSSDLLNLVYMNEALEANAEVSESVRISPAMVSHVEKNIFRFARYLSDYSIPNKKFTKLINEVPDVLLNSKTSSAVSGMFKESDVDPFSSGYVVGFIASPIYHVRLMWAEWQASRYKASKDKKKTLELRLLHLRLLKEKKNDPKLEEEILYIQGRVDKLERYLQEVDASLGTED